MNLWNRTLEQAASVYIPADYRRALAQGTTLPERTSGAALFADISGFTPLTEALARDLGPQRGAEELTRQLNLVYDALIAQVDRYGGSVIGFSGDAITCWFDDSIDTLSLGKPQAARRAVACAFGMQATMSKLATVVTPSGGQLTLAMKVAVASGPVRRFLVGDPNFQIIDVLAGATLVRLAAAEHLAGRNEIVLSGEVVSAVGDAATILEWREDEAAAQRCAFVGGLTAAAEPSPWPALSGDALSEEQVRPWVLPPVYERLRDGQGAFLTELRPAVSLFLRFGGIDYDADESAGAKLDAYIRWVQKVLRPYEGMLIQLTIGDKGSYLYAAFGAPIAHEDDTWRAVTVALELRSLPADLGFIQPVQIGISQGTMRTGDYGGTTRRTYGVLGDEVNLAARLMQHAQPGDVLVSRRVQKTVAEAFTWEPLPPVQVKGKSEPVPIYRLRDRKTKGVSAVPQATIIGRELEQAILAESVQRLASGTGGVVIIEGEAGMGKALLAEDLKRQATAMQVGTLSGAASEVDRSTPYHAWQGVFSQLFDLGALQTPEQQQRRLMALIKDQPEALRLAPLLNPVLPFGLPDNEHTSQMAGQERAQSTRQLMAQILQNTVERSPQVIILEDTHWLDSLSWELAVQIAHTLVASGAPLLLVLVTRPIKEHGPAAWSMNALQAMPETRLLRLGPLKPEATVAIAAARLDVPEGSLPEPVAALIRQQAEGNPFFAEEMVLMLREQGLVTVEPDPARAGMARPNRCLLTGDLGAIQTLPDTIQGLILARMDRLPPEQQLTLKVSAVIGRIFACTPLSHTLKQHIAISEDDLQAHLEDLTALVLIALHSPEPDLTYLFEQIITQEVAYQTLLFAQRQQLHRAVAEWYEAAYPERLDEFVTALAFHYTRADVDAKAIEYLMRAGARAHKLYALQEATEHYQEALRRIEKRPADQTVEQRQIIHAALGELLTIASQYEQAAPHLDQALALASARDDADAQAHVCRWLARLHELRGEYPPALDWVERGLAVLAGRETSEAAEMLLIAGLIYTRQGEYDNALAYCARALRIAEKLDVAPALARAHNMLGHIARLHGDRIAAIEQFRLAFDLHQRTGDLHGQATLYNQIANAYFDMGQWREAEQAYVRARTIFDKIGDLYNRAIANNNLGGILRNQGRLREALMFYEQALHTMEQIGGSVWILGVLHMNLGGTFVRQCEIAEARRHLQISHDYFQQAQSRDFLPEMRRCLAEAALCTGELLEAAAQGQQALSLARELAMRGEEGCSLRVLGEIALAQGQLDLAQERLDQSVTILEEVKDEYERARSQLALARLYAAQKQSQAALNVLGLCKTTFERLGADLDLNAARALQEAIV